MSHGSNEGSVAGGLILLFLVVAAIGVAVVIVVKVLPHVFKGIVAITRMSLGPLAGGLRHTPLGWPSEESASSIGTVVILATLGWGLVGLVAGISLWALTGPSATVALTTTVVGAVLGGMAGAASVPKNPAPEAGDNLDDYINW